MGGVGKKEGRGKMAKATDSYTGLQKKTIIKREKEKLNGIYLRLDEETKKATASLIDEAAFMAASLYELRKSIDEKGYTEKYQNGANQWGTKKRSEVEIYNTLIKNYQATIKQLTDLIPKDDRFQKSDNFDDFSEFIQEKNK